MASLLGIPLSLRSIGMILRFVGRCKGEDASGKSQFYDKRLLMIELHLPDSSPHIEYLNFILSPGETLGRRQSLCVGALPVVVQNDNSMLEINWFSQVLR
jgi:hypothetical protein